MAEKTLVDALVKAQSEMTHAVLDQVNPQFQSKFASLRSVIDAVKPALNKNGIAFIQRSIPMENGISIETVLYGHGEEITTGAVPVPAQKITAQGYGSAMTYAKRYSLAMACGVAADEDDDGEAAEVEQPPSAPKAKKKSSPPPEKKPAPRSDLPEEVEFYQGEEGATAFLKLYKYVVELETSMPGLQSTYRNNQGKIATIQEHQPQIFDQIKAVYNRRKAHIEKNAGD